MPTPASQQPDEISLQPGALLSMIRNLQGRVTFLERQHRMLLDELAEGRPVSVCLDSRCQAGPVPHVAEQPDLCPILARQ